MNQNGHNGIQQNGHGASLGVATDGGPYTIRRRPEGFEEETVHTDIDAKEPKGGLALDDEEALGATEPKRDRKRRFLFMAFLSLALVGVAAFAYMRLGGSTKIEHQVKSNRPSGITQQAQKIQGETADQQTEAAIAQAKEARRAGDEARPLGTGDTASRPDSPTIEAPPPALPRLSIPREYVDPRDGKIPAGEPGGVGGALTGGEQPGAGRARNRTAGQPRNGTSSVYTSAGEEAKAPAVRMPAATAAAFGPKLSLTRKEKGVTLPAFGAMLPVRTLGAVYTLRNSLARLELTRDISGEGWALKKGTVLIAQQQGAALDRAYVSITGFIDPASNRFVKMTGEVLGSDGAPGLKGKRRQISSRWSRAFNRILNVAPGIAQAALARNGGTTVIVPTGGAATDLIGTGNFSSDRREFVEVEAGSPGYVMVTDLPDTTKGVDADPEKFSSGGEQGPLSDGELAKLLSDGTPQQIKAAMPRMTPEMRRVATLAIGEPEK
jgi:hypothetical protein